MDIIRMTEKERISFASLFLIVSKSLLDGTEIDPSIVQEAHNYISELLESTNLSQNEKSELADLAITMNEAKHTSE